MSIVDLCTQKILLTPWSLSTLSPPTPSPLEAVASLLLPVLPECTSLVLSSLPFPSEFWSTRSRALAGLPKDATAMLSFTLHAPTVSDSGDFERLYLHPLLCGVLGVTCIDSAATQGRVVDGISAFFDASKSIMKKFGIPTFLLPPAHLLVFDFSNDDQSTESILSSDKLGRDARSRVHVVRVGSSSASLQLLVDEDIKRAISALEVDVILQLLEDFRATAAAGGDAQIVASKTQQLDDPEGVKQQIKNNPFVGRLSGGVDVALTVGLSQVSVVMGTAKRRLHARLLRRRGEAALLIGSYVDALDNLDKASKAAKASIDELGLALIDECRAAALYRKELALNPRSRTTVYQQDVVSSLREAVVHAETAASSTELLSSFIGVGSLQVVMRLRLADYILMTTQSTPSHLPREVSRWMALSGEGVSVKQALVTASLDFDTDEEEEEEEGIEKVSNKNKSIRYVELRGLSSTMSKMNNAGERCQPFSTISTAASLHTSTSPSSSSSSTPSNAALEVSPSSISGLSPFSEISDCLAKSSILCATSVRPLSQQIRCILLTCRLTSQIGLRRKAEVLLLRAARLLRSLQTGLPLDVESAFPSTTGNNYTGGCVYAAAVEMQPISSLPLMSSIQDENFHDSFSLPPSSSLLSSEVSEGHVKWPWPWIHSSCMIATQALPLSLRSCAPSVISASLTLAAFRSMTVGSNDIKTSLSTSLSTTTPTLQLGLRGGCLQTQSLRRAAIADLFQSGEFALVLSLLGEDILESCDDQNQVGEQHIDQVIRLPSSSRMLRSLSPGLTAHVNDADDLLSCETSGKHSCIISSSSAATSLATSILSDSRSTLHSSMFHRNACIRASVDVKNPVGVVTASLLYGFRIDGHMSISTAKASLIVLSSLFKTSESLAQHSHYGSCRRTSRDTMTLASRSIHSRSRRENVCITRGLFFSSPCSSSFRKYFLLLMRRVQEMASKVALEVSHAEEVDLDQTSSSLSSSAGVLMSTSSSSLIKNSSSFSFSGGSSSVDDGINGNIDDQGSPGVYATPRLLSGQGFEAWRYSDLLSAIVKYIATSTGIRDTEDNTTDSSSSSSTVPPVVPSLASSTMNSSRMLSDESRRRRRSSSSTSSTNPSLLPAPFVTAELPSIYGTSWLLIP